MLLFGAIVLILYYPVRIEAFKLLVLSFDGFRHDYISLRETPTLHHLVKNGLYVPKVQPVFPASKTPNLYSIATGWHPGGHGVFNNPMYDPLSSSILDDNNHQTFDYNPFAVPIWVLNQQVKDGLSATIMWTGGNIAINNIKPIYYMSDNIDISWEERFERVIDYLTDENYSANLVLMAFESPADAVLYYGPNNDHIKDSVKKVDNALSVMLDLLKINNLLDDINIIITTDAGYLEVDYNNIINLTEIITMDDVEVFGVSPVLSIVPKYENDIPIYQKLKEASRYHNFTVYHKLEIPSKWKCSGNRRLGTMLAVADEGFAFQDIHVEVNSTIGLSGYDNYIENTYGFFVGFGPSFIPGRIDELISNVDLYPLMCTLLDIKIPPNNGSLDPFSPFIHGHSLVTITIYQGGIVIACIVILCCTIFLVTFCKRSKSQKHFTSDDGFLFRNSGPLCTKYHPVRQNEDIYRDAPTLMDT